MISDSVVFISITDDYKAGDLPPENGSYLEWSAWADAQHKAGIKQVECGKCGKWKTPQELDTEKLKSTVFDKNMEEIEIEEPHCIDCAIKRRLEIVENR